MAQKWYEYAEKCTAPDEHLGKNYTGKLDGSYGHLMLSDKKLIFVKEEGLFRKKYSAPLLLPYDEVKDIRPIDNYRMEISEKTGKTHKFETDLNVSNIEKAIREEMTLKYVHNG